MASKETKSDEKTETNDKKEEVSTSDGIKEVEQSVKVDTLANAWKRITLGSMFAIISIALLSIVVIDDNYLNFNISGKITVFELSNYWHKMEFVLCHQIVGLTCLLVNMYYVCLKRGTSAAVDPLSGHEDIPLKAKNIMTNTLEQFLMSAFAQIISVSFIEVKLLIKIIPIVNLLFLIGRLTFWLGYPKYRTFGFMCTTIPNTLLITYNLFKFLDNFYF